MLGGSWVGISKVISALTWAVTIVTRLITPLITTHEPPSRVLPGHPGAATEYPADGRKGSSGDSGPGHTVDDINPALPIIRKIR